MDFLVTRDIQNSWIFQDAEKFKWWVDLLLMADENGEVHMNLSDLYHRWKKPKPNIVRFLEKLSAERLSGIKVERLSGTIKICVTMSYKGVRNDTSENCGTTTKERFSSSLSPIPPITPSLKENIIVDNNAHTHEENFDLRVGVLASEERYIRQYQEEGLWVDAAISAHLTVSQVQDIFQEFLVEQKHNSATHRDYPDFKRHFLNYLRVKAEILRKQSKQSDNGNQRKYEDRRGTEVNPSADYTKPL